MDSRLRFTAQRVKNTFIFLCVLRLSCILLQGDLSGEMIAPVIYRSYVHNNGKG